MIGCSSADQESTDNTAASADAVDTFAGDSTSDERREFASVRRATAKYHDINVAIQDGYVRVSPCNASPELGGMGVHYLNQAQAMKPLDIDHPALLNYEPTDDGLELVAVEYIQFVFQDGRPYNGATPPRPSSIQPNPVLYGETFQGPMPGHSPGAPWHFDLHAWVWKHNPSGMFAQFNPNVFCPAP
jgi:hypothetical protein